MVRIARYLKPYTLLILLTIGFLFAQAMADLALPNYISEIVNIGIQQGGIESAIPQAIRQSEMERVTLFLNADAKSRVLADYTLIDQNSTDYAQYSGRIPGAENGTGLCIESHFRRRNRSA